MFSTNIMIYRTTGTREMIMTHFLTECQHTRPRIVRTRHRCPGASQVYWWERCGERKYSPPAPDSFCGKSSGGPLLEKGPLPGLFSMTIFHSLCNVMSGYIALNLKIKHFNLMIKKRRNLSNELIQSDLMPSLTLIWHHAKLGLELIHYRGSQHSDDDCVFLPLKMSSWSDQGI